MQTRNNIVTVPTQTQPIFHQDWTGQQRIREKSDRIKSPSLSDCAIVWHLHAGAPSVCVYRPHQKVSPVQLRQISMYRMTKRKQCLFICTFYDSLAWKRAIECKISNMSENEKKKVYYTLLWFFSGTKKWKVRDQQEMYWDDCSMIVQHEKEC